MLRLCSWLWNVTSASASSYQPLLQSPCSPSSKDPKKSQCFCPNLSSGQGTLFQYSTDSNS
jgi:hypothetical protein